LKRAHARCGAGLVAGTALALSLLGPVVGAAAAQPDPISAAAQELEERDVEEGRSLVEELGAAAVRLPLAAALGAVLALRPRRRGSPPRRSAVIATQIVLAVVGALIMLVVGVSLARAFGIVGVASLIRYRSKISDPRDAVVMLSALAVGLASGTGHFALALFATGFLFALLWVVESFERSTRTFDLSLKLGDKSVPMRPAIEQILRRHDIEFELRGTSEEENVYFVMVPSEVSTNRVSKELAALAPNGVGAVEWNEKPKAQAK
jgi:hypothetical protein